MGNITSTFRRAGDDQATTHPECVQIEIGKTSNELPITYNVSQIIQEYKRIPAEWQKKLEIFFKKLDNKTKIDLEDQDYEPVKFAIEQCVDRICDELSKTNGIFSTATKIPTGSLYAGLQVGLPLEADFLLELQSKSDICKCIQSPHRQAALLEMLYQDIKTIAENMMCNKKERTMYKWILYDVIKMKVGVRLVMQYKAKPQRPGIATILDLIPVIQIKRKNLSTAWKYTCDTKQYISGRRLKAVQEKWQLLCSGHADTQDTAFVQHNLLLHLPEDLPLGTFGAQKSAVRVAKYLLQSQLVSEKPRINSEESSRNSVSLGLDKTQSMALYGYAPMVRSYTIQLLLVHFLTKTQHIEQDITSPILILCLLDMLYTVCEVTETSSVIEMNNPVFEDRDERMRLFDCNPYIVIVALQNLTCSLLQHVLIGNMNPYPLMNSPSNFSPLTGIYFTGFGRGSSLNEFAKVHNCSASGCPRVGTLQRARVHDNGNPPKEADQSDENCDLQQNVLANINIRDREDIHSYIKMDGGMNCAPLDGVNLGFVEESDIGYEAKDNSINEGDWETLEPDSWTAMNFRQYDANIDENSGDVNNTSKKLISTPHPKNVHSYINIKEEKDIDFRPKEARQVLMDKNKDKIKESVENLLSDKFSVSPGAYLPMDKNKNSEGKNDENLSTSTFKVSANGHPSLRQDENIDKGNDEDLANVTFGVSANDYIPMD